MRRLTGIYSRCGRDKPIVLELKLVLALDFVDPEIVRKSKCGPIRFTGGHMSQQTVGCPMSNVKMRPFGEIPGFVAYSPLGRGILTANIAKIDDLAPDDWRRPQPWFQKSNFDRNLSPEIFRAAHQDLEACSREAGSVSRVEVKTEVRNL
jgi:hypothetical protein